MNNSDFSKISYGKVQEYAAELNSSAKDMEVVLTEVKNLFDKVGTDDVWNGTAASQQREQFDTLSSKFFEFYEAIGDCSEYLNKIVSRAQELDAKITGQQ